MDDVARDRERERLARLESLRRIIVDQALTIIADAVA